MGTFETINLWEDWVPNGWNSAFFSSPVFSEPEREAIKEFCCLWDKTAAVAENNLFDAKEICSLAHWAEYIEAAKFNFCLFMERGRFSEELENF